MIRPEAYREREIPGLDEMPLEAPATEAGALGAHDEPAPRPSWSKRFLSLFVSAWSFWRQERDISRSIAALSAMDDQILRDIGIEHRLQIPEIVRHGRRRA